MEANEDEDKPEVILKDDDETLDDMYMSRSEADNATFVQIDSGWRETCIASKFCSMGAEAFITGRRKPGDIRLGT